MAPFGDPVVVDQLGIRPLRPAARGGVQLVGKHGHTDRDLYTLGVEEGQLALPVQPRRGDRRVRQPVVGDVVEDVVSGQAAGLSEEGARDELVAAHIVVEHPGRQADRRVRDAVERLRAVRHLVGIADAGREEVDQHLIRCLLLGGEARRWRVADRDRPRDVGRNRGRHVRVDAEQPRRRQQGHLLGDGVAPVAALCDEVRVAEPVHQHDPGTGDADGVPAGLGRLTREPVARQRRDHEMEGVRGARAVPVGSVSGSMIFNCSIVEPGHPCVTISGSALSCSERTWMKWMSTPSISVTKCGRAANRPSNARQS